MENTKTKPKRIGLKRFLPFVKPHLKYFIIGPICMIVEVIGEVLMPKMLSYIIDFGVYTSSEKEVPQFVRAIFNAFGNNNFIVAMAAGMILTAILMMLGGVGGAYFGAKASVNFATDLRQAVFEKIQNFSFSNTDRFSTGSLVTRVTNDVTQLQNFVNMLLRMCLRAPGMMIGALIMAIILSPSLSVILAVSIPLMIGAIIFIIFKGFPRFSAMQTKIDALNSTVGENLTNVRVVKSFVREEYETEKFKTANGNLKTAMGDAFGVMILMSPVMTFVMNATSIAVLWFGGNQLLSDPSFGTGDLAAFVTYITQILSSLMILTFLFVIFARAIASGKRIAEVLDEKIDIEDFGADDSLRVGSGDIDFKKVSFRYYKNSEEEVLSDINLHIASGETVGIIGSTGCGKTTLVSMIPRLYDVDKGEVLVAGRNVKDYTLFHLREGVGMVLQKNVLFSGSILDNLRWGNEAASDEDVRTAADAAQATGFVEEFKDGFLTDLDQGGSNVSGGQKQRLCIARALLKKPKILILDDSTSAVDTATEARIRQAFKTSLKDSTKIIIAQRISSVKDADRIVVMNDGKITGIGTHDELLAGNIEYQEIYYSQVDREEESANGSQNA